MYHNNIYPARACAARGKVISRGVVVWEAVKPGLDWTMDWTVDWTVDWTMDWTAWEPFCTMLP